MTIQTVKVGSLTPELLDLIFTLAPNILVNPKSGVRIDSPNVEEIARLASVLIGTHVSADDIIRLAEEIELEPVDSDYPTAEQEAEDRTTHYEAMGMGSRYNSEIGYD